MKKNRSLYKILGVLISISMLFSLAPSVVAVEALEAAENALSEISENISAQAESYNSTAITVTEPSQDSDGYYLIGTAGELYWFAEYVNAGNSQVNAKLTADIVVNGNLLESITYDDEGNVTNGDSFNLWNPIGYRVSSSEGVAFSGVFDGRGYEISGLYYNNVTDGSYIGLFGNALSATIKNIGLVDSYIAAMQYVGGICGYLKDTSDAPGEISGCYNTSSIKGAMTVAGICSYAGSYTVISNCYNEGEITGFSTTYNYDENTVLTLGGAVGGIMGFGRCSITDCYNTGDISGYLEIGGISGYSIGSVTKCYNTGNVSAETSQAGGIAGDSYDCITTDCYNTGNVSAGTTCAGGINGRNQSDCSIVNCYNSGTVTGTTDCVGSIVGSATVASILPVNSYYLENTASLSDGTAMTGVGVAEGETPADTEGVTESKTAEEFASGEVTYLLNNGVQNGTQSWYQTLGVDDYPAFEGETVYRVAVYADCQTNERLSFAYNNSGHSVAPHTLNEWGLCTVCSEYNTPDYLDGYYLISTPGELYWFADYVNNERYANARLVADITINENVLTEEGELNGDGSDFLEWTPIGYGQHFQEEIWWYEGVFLGDGYTISGLYIGQGCDYYDGFFSALGGNGSISGVNITDSYIYGNGAGGIVAYIESGIVENCSFDGLVVGTDEECGGVAGSSGGTIKNCVNYGTVRANYYFVGGVVGYNGGTVENCYNYGTVSGGSSYCGSIAGVSEGNNDYISNCYYLESTATYNDGSAMLGVGVYSGTPTDSEGVTESKNAEEFASGEVTYLLNDGVTDGSQAWYQTLETDAYPVFKGKTVYKINVYSDCTKAEFTGTVYSNKATDTAPHLNYDDNGFCVVCQGFKEPELSSDRYLISNAGELYWFAEQVNSGNNAIDGKVTADITINENLLESLEYDENGNVTNGDSFRQWTPIGYCNSDGERLAYDGYFYCGSYDIIGLYFNDSTRDYAGLFGCIGEEGKAVEIVIKDSYICGNDYVGAIAGEFLGLTTQFNYNYSVVKGNNYVGGIYGYNEDSTYRDKNYGEVSGVEYVGGVVGYATNTLNNSGNEGTVNGSKYVGGVAGYAKGDFIKVSNTGDVTGTVIVGGLAGYCGGDIGNRSIYDYCYNTGTVSSNDVETDEIKYVGGICGIMEGSRMDYTYNEGAVSGEYAGGLCASSTTVDITYCYNAGSVYGSDCAGGLVGNYQNKTITSSHNAGSVTSDKAEYRGGIAGVIASADIVGSYCVSSPVGTSDSESVVEAGIMTAEDFASGKVTYYLNSSITEDEVIWKQNVDNDSVHSAWPKLHGAEIYYVAQCKAVSDIYTNIEHDGLCYGCGFDEPALSEDGYYEISTVSELYWFARYVNETDPGANGRLVNDIEVNPAIKCDSNGTALTDTTGFYIWRDEIGDYTGSNGLLYSGTFDGCGYIITGLYKESTHSYVGLFGGVSGVVKNVGLYGCFFGEEPVIKNGGEYVGGIAGYSKGTIEKCFLTDSCIEGDMRVGGIVGYVNSGSINNCYNNGTGNGRPYVISDWNVGSRVGGIAGESYGSITNCYSTAYVKGNTLFGAICGLTSRNAENTNNFYIKRSVYRPNANTYGWLAFGGADYYSSFPDEGRATQYATLDGMLTGEMAYLLQSANTEQVWGQKANNNSNTSYPKLPVIDTTGIYKVAKVGDTGNYSVANIGDTNGDGTVDVIDYQALVNKALADDHEQIETASYDDIIRYDLDGDGYLNVLDAFLMEQFINGHKTIKVYPPGDIDSSGVSFYNEEEILLVAEKIATPEKLSTAEKYACDMNADGKVNNKDLIVLKEKYPQYFKDETA